MVFRKKRVIEIQRKERYESAGKLEDVIRKEIEKIEKKLDDEKKDQANHIFKLNSYRSNPDYLKGIPEEKCRLVVLFDSESQAKTLCFQPSQSKWMRLEGLETSHFIAKTTKELHDNENACLKQYDRELRTRIENTSTFPYSVHGLVRADRGGGNYLTGTGILIGPDLVLTATHNIYDYKGTKQQIKDIVLIPGINEQVIPFGVFKLLESYVPKDFLTSWEKEDYALLVLDGAPGTLAGFFGLHVAHKEIIKEKRKKLNVIGYPGYVRTKVERKKLKVLTSKGRHQLWGMEGEGWLEADEENGNFLIHYPDMMTTSGQSGSGEFYHDEATNQYYIIGIHILRSLEENGYSSATWITRQRFDQIKEWISQARKALIYLEEYHNQIKMEKLSSRT